MVEFQSADEWRIVFYIASSVYFFGCVIYGCFASGELQSWAIESQPLNKSIKPGNDNTSIQAHENPGFEQDNL